MPDRVLSIARALEPQLDKQGDDSLFVILAIARVWQSQDGDSGLSAPKPECLTTSFGLAYNKYRDSS